jgi:hypothetical protein
MIFGNALAIWNSCGLWVILVKATYREALNTNTPMIIPKLKEKIITKSEATTEIIIMAK